MTGGLFGGYNKLQNAVYSRIDEANAIRLEKAAREYSDYMKNAYRLMNDPNLREIAERRIGDTMIPSAMRTASRETGEMNFGNVLPKKAGTVSAEQMYGVKLSQENKNEDFAEWAAREDAKKVTNGQQIEENASYSRKIDNIESLSEGGYIPVGRVFKGSALNNIGLASTNIYFDKSKIVKSLDEHSDHITKEILKQIPQILNEPIVITEANADNTANVFGNVYIGSSPLMVGIMVTKSRDGKTEINKIRTVHARRDAGKKITDSSVLYLNPNIEKTQTWFQALGNDVPLGGTKFGFIRRITDKLKKVNSENKAAKGTELKIKKEPDSQVTHGRQLPYGINETDSNGDVPSPETNIPQNGNGVNTLDAENSAAKVQQNSENAAKVQQRKPGTVSAEQMYGVKLSQENRNEDFAEWAEKEDAKKKKAAEEADGTNAGSDGTPPNRRNVDYENKEERNAIQSETHNRMVSEEKVVDITQSVNDKKESFPDLRTMKKAERLPVIKQKMNELKNALREQLSKLKVNNFEFEINGTTIEAKLYDAGIREVLEKLTQKKAGMLSLSKKIFESAEYLYSTQDKRGDTNIEAWDYFYVPIKIGDETAGVRIAIRAVSNPKGSQIYNWGIKNDTSLGGVGHTPFGSNSNGTSSDVSKTNIPQNGNSVNTLDAENSAAKAQQRKPGTVSAEQMYGVKLSQENKNEDFAEWAEKEDAKKKKAAEKEATLAEKQKNADNSNLTNREKYSLSEQEVTEIKKGVSVITDADNNTIIDIKSNILEDIPKEDWLKRVKNVIRSVFPKGFNLNGEHIDVSAKSRGEFVKSKDSVYLRDKSPEIYRDKMETAPHLDVISQNTEFQNVPPDHARTDNIVSFDKGRVNLKIGGNDYSAEVVIGVKDDGNKVFYDIVGMDANKRRPPSGSQSAQTANTRAQEPSDNISSNDSITDTSENFKSKSENSAAKVQQETENAAKAQRRKPGTVSAEQMYGVKLSQENKNEDFEQWAEKEDAKKKKAAEKEATLAEKQKNADSRSIRTDMTDDERYEALKNEKIKIEPYNSEKLKGENIEELSSKPFKEAKKYIKTLAEKFEVFKKYASEKAKVEFQFSRNNLIESEAKQKVLTPEYAEMLSATDAIVQNAVLVEAHKDKYAGTTREDKTLLQTDVLLSAFADENGIVPVRLTVKEFKDKENSLYALITLEKIETEIVGRGESLATTPTPYPVSEMSIPDIVSKIKPTDGKILKYLPDKLLSAEQLEGKRAALAKDKEKIEGFSQKGDFAAKVQQTETEEEARLRTLYESAVESPADEAYDGADDVQKFIDDVKKRREDAGISDEDLKGMSKDRQKNVLSERAERAGLDMDAEGLVDFAQSIGKVKGFYGTEFKDFARVFDDVSSGNEKMRNELHKLLEVPHREAQRRYTESYKNAVKAISDKFIIPSTFLFMPQNPFRHIPNRLLDGAWVVAEAPCGGLVAEHTV